MSRRVTMMAMFAVAGVVCLLIAGTIAMRFGDATIGWSYYGGTVPWLVLIAIISHFFGLNRIPRVSTDGRSWVRAAVGGRIVTATPANIVEIVQGDGLLTIKTSEGQFEVTPDCSGYLEIGTLIRGWAVAGDRSESEGQSVESSS